jgi:hypothetical protein
MAGSDAELTAALRAYALRSLETLRVSEWTLPPIHLRDWGWQPREQSFFVYQSSENTPIPLLPPDAGLLHGLPEFAACLEALRAHPVIGERLDTLVGSAISAARLEAEHIPDNVLYAMLRDQTDLEFHEPSFDRAADELIAWLTRSESVHTTVAPLSGVIAESTPIVLEPGIEIDVMSDAEVIDCLTTGILGGVGSMGHSQVGPRIALRIRESLPLAIGDEHPDRNDSQKPQAAWERWRALGEAVVFALRLLKSGIVSSPGFVSKGDAYRGMRGGSFTPSITPRHSVFESYRLNTSDSAALIALWSQMRSPRVRPSGPLDTAIRRFGFAGERARTEDQIIDLMIAAEALFLPGEDRGESAHKLSLRAGLLLGDGEHSAQDVATLMRRAYDARSRLAHGARLKPLKLPDGSPATLPEYVEIVGDYMRQALRQLIEAAAESRPSPVDDWDSFTFDRLSRRADQSK